MKFPCGQIQIVQLRSSSLSDPSAESRARRMPRYLRRWSTVAFPEVLIKRVVMWSVGTQAAEEEGAGPTGCMSGWGLKTSSISVATSSDATIRKKYCMYKHETKIGFN